MSKKTSQDHSMSAGYVVVVQNMPFLAFSQHHVTDKSAGSIVFTNLMAQTTQNSDTIEISDDEPNLYQEWDEKKWIGIGKTYPVFGEVPAFIEAARSKVLALPPIYSSYIPE